MTRRSFLKIALVPLTATAVGALSWGRVRAKILNQLWRFEYHFTHPDITKVPTGSLADHILRSLISFVEALAGGPIETVHYEIFFGWRAQNLEGTRELYEKFAATLDRRAESSHHCPFRECDLASRRKIVRRFILTSRLSQYSSALSFNRDSLRFYNHIIKPVLKLYCRTDAWVAAGYQAWPGQARGLDAYRMPRRA